MMLNNQLIKFLKIKQLHQASKNQRPHTTETFPSEQKVLWDSNASHKAY